MRTIITSDYHIPYMNRRAFNKVLDYSKEFKPDLFIINGDFVDFYNLSTFDKDPRRKENLVTEINKARETLEEIREALPKARIVYIEGNHENRLQKYLWKNSELEGLTELELPSLLRLEKLKIEHLGVSRDYWSDKIGHLILGNVVVTHGDSRINGTSTSKFSGYSAKNSMLNLQTSIVIGHSHRLAHIYHTTPYGVLEGLECGCMCKVKGTANWQNGFVTINGGELREHKV